MKNILFTTAYSKSSKNTWQYALRLAQYFGAKITLMHVYKDVEANLFPGYRILGEEMFDNLEDFDVHFLKEQQHRLKDFSVQNTPNQYDAIPLVYIVAAGDVASAILHEESENAYDLIVLGTTTAHRLSNALFGRTSIKVLAQSKASVFLVPPMSRYHGINKVVYATNFETGDLTAIQHLMEWTAAFNAEFHLLHVHKKTLGAVKALEKMQNLLRHFQEENETGTLTHELLEGNAAASIEEYLKINDSDMIALTTHKKGLFAQLFDPGLSNQIATEALVPVLLFKGK